MKSSTIFLFAISSLFLFSCTHTKLGEAGFISSNIRLVTPLPDSNLRGNPIIKPEEVIDRNTLFSNAALKQDIQLIAWKGEKVHTQVAIKLPADQNPTFSIKLAPLKSETNNSSIKDAITISRVGSVITDEYFQGCGYRPDPTSFHASLVTDVLLPDTTTIQDSIAVFWISIKVPADADSGSYLTTVETSNGFELPLRLRVINQTLPPPANWSFDLDLWQHPAAIARVHHVKLWSNEHYDRMRPYYEMLAAAGQKNITASIVEEPWGHQTFDDFPSLIKWTRRKNGSWSFDFSRFDEYISFVMSCGIKQRINCYTVIPWKMVVRYYDEAMQKDTSIATEINTPVYETTWKPMLTALTQHLKEKNWFNITTIAMDERPMPAMKTAIALLKSIDPNWKIALAGDYHPEIESDIFDYCVASRWVLDSTLLNKRKTAGKPTTVYTCCTEAYPNGFSFSPPAEHVYLGWYARAKGFTGYLRWAYNSWTKAPLQDTRYTAWPAGDTYQVYPGPYSSIRFEKMIEGVQDFEKLRILEETYIRNGNTQKLAELKSVLSQFNIPQLADTSARSIIEKAKAIFEQ